LIAIDNNAYDTQQKNSGIGSHENGLYWLRGISVLKYEKPDDCPCIFLDTMTIFSLYFRPFSERMSHVASTTIVGAIRTHLLPF
jgi:hypothetical protein